MSLLVFRDHQGDRVVVDHRWLVGLRVGHVEGKGLVTLIATVGGTFPVGEQLADVEAAWREARSELHQPIDEPFPEAHPGTIGWEQQYPTGPKP